MFFSTDFGHSWKGVVWLVEDSAPAPARLEALELEFEDDGVGDMSGLGFEDARFSQQDAAPGFSRTFPPEKPREAPKVPPVAVFSGEQSSTGERGLVQKPWNSLDSDPKRETGSIWGSGWTVPICRVPFREVDDGIREDLQGPGMLWSFLKNWGEMFFRVLLLGSVVSDIGRKGILKTESSPLSGLSVLRLNDLVDPLFGVVALGEFRLPGPSKPGLWAVWMSPNGSSDGNPGIPQEPKVAEKSGFSFWASGVFT